MQIYRVVHESPNLDGVPEPLRTVVADAMHPNPAERPTAQQLVRRARHLRDVRETVGKNPVYCLVRLHPAAESVYRETGVSPAC
jgi:hypothetical protein